MEVLVIYRRLVLAVLLLFAVAVPVFAVAGPQFKSFQGTWTCPICDAKHFHGTQAECEAFNHKHCLKLNDGTYISFLESPRSKVLIAGGGRHDTRMEVCGLYDSNTRVLDVFAFKIDGIWSTWCEKDQQMDPCEAEALAGVEKQDYSSAR